VKWLPPFCRAEEGGGVGMVKMGWIRESRREGGKKMDGIKIWNERQFFVMISTPEGTGEGNLRKKRRVATRHSKRGVGISVIERGEQTRD